MYTRSNIMNPLAFRSPDGSVEDRGDILSPVPLSRGHDHDIVPDGERVHVVQHDVVRERKQGGLARQRGVFVQHHLKRKFLRCCKRLKNRFLVLEADEVGGWEGSSFYCPRAS